MELIIQEPSRQFRIDTVNTHLIVPYEQFKRSVEDKMADGQRLSRIVVPNINADIDLTDAYAHAKVWKQETLDVLGKCFNKSDNVFVEKFISLEIKHYTTNSLAELEEGKRRLIEQVTGMWNYLITVFRIVKVCDTLREEKWVLQDERVKYTEKQKSDLLLKKLYELYDTEDFYPVKVLIEGNGIALRRSGEELELARHLSEQGHIEIHGADHNLVRLKWKGKLKIQEAEESQHTGDEPKSVADLKNMSNTIDEIWDELKKQGYGQEIIFDELQDLKNAYARNNKKNFWEIVRCKMFDLTVDKVVSVETADFVIHKVTGEHITEIFKKMLGQ